MRDERDLTARRLRRMELKFDKQAIDNLDCTAAFVAIKARAQGQFKWCGVGCAVAPDRSLEPLAEPA